MTAGCNDDVLPAVEFIGHWRGSVPPMLGGVCIPSDRSAPIFLAQERLSK